MSFHLLSLPFLAAFPFWTVRKSSKAEGSGLFVKIHPHAPHPINPPSLWALLLQTSPTVTCSIRPLCLMPPLSRTLYSSVGEGILGSQNGTKPVIIQCCPGVLRVTRVLSSSQRFGPSCEAPHVGYSLPGAPSAPGPLL